MIGIRKLSLFFTVLMLLSLVLSASTQAQNRLPKSPSTGRTGSDEVAKPGPTVEPVFKDYKGVRIGMNADEVAERLGEPKVKAENEEIFLISDFEMVQVFYDKDQGVKAISITYSAEHANAPTALAVLGEDVDVDADGRMYKLIRYPEVGYWVAYSRTAGEAPVVSVTLNKM